MNNLIKRVFPLELNFELKNYICYLKRSQKVMTAENGMRKVIFCDAASYNNMGDQAIALAMSTFVRDLVGDENYVEISEKNFLESFASLKKIVKENDIICLSGGGNMGDLYPRYEAIRRKVIKGFPRNEIIIFPQTIDYQNNAYGKRELQRSAKAYNAHKKLLICARESQSYTTMKQVYKNVYMVSDIVFYLYGKFDIQSHSKRKIGVCLRHDRESSVSDEIELSIFKAIREMGYELTTLSTMSGDKQEIVNNSERRMHLITMLETFKECECIITDRLHGMIFSIIAAVPCLIIDNSNHKVFGVYETVQPYLQGVEKLESATNVKDKLKKAMRSTVKLEFSQISYSILAEMIMNGKLHGEKQQAGNKKSIEEIKC